jgi:hypothetical protein
MFRAIFLTAMLFALAAPANAAVQSKKVVYKHGNLECHGYLAWDDAVKGPRPGVLVVPNGGA